MEGDFRFVNEVREPHLLTTDTCSSPILCLTHFTYPTSSSILILQDATLLTPSNDGIFTLNSSTHHVFGRPSIDLRFCIPSLYSAIETRYRTITPLPPVTRLHSPQDLHDLKLFIILIDRPSTLSYDISYKFGCSPLVTHDALLRYT